MLLDQRRPDRAAVGLLRLLGRVRVYRPHAGARSHRHADHRARPLAPPVTDRRLVGRCVLEPVLGERGLVRRLTRKNRPAPLRVIERGVENVLLARVALRAGLQIVIFVCIGRRRRLRLGLTVTVGLCPSCAALTPHDGPIEGAIETRQLLDRVEPITGHGQHFWSAPAQLRDNLLAVDLDRVFLMHRVGAVVGQTQDQAAVAAWRYFRISMARRVEEILRPDVNRARAAMTAVGQLDRGEWIRLGHHISDAVRMPGLPCRHCGCVVAPGAGIRQAGRALRLGRHEIQLFPAIIPAPPHPLFPLDQRQQRWRQLCQIALVRARFVVQHDVALHLQ